MNTTNKVYTQNPIQLKTDFMSCTYLQISRTSTDEIKYEVKNLIAQAPKLVKDLPIIVDFSKLNLIVESVESIKPILQILVKSPLKIIGVIPPSDSNTPFSFPWPDLKHLSTKKTKKIPASMAIKHIKGRVRSGQVINAYNEHLMIYGDVSSGAELYASGNIYVFGTLMGKVFAGAMGYDQAQIACQCLLAEMVAISGRYQTLDDLNGTCINKGATVISLNKDKLVFKSV